MKPKEPMTQESATKAIKHIQKVFYIVGGLNFLYAINLYFTYPSSFVLPVIVPGAIISFIIIYLGFLLTTKSRRKVPKGVRFLAIFLVIVHIADAFLVGEIPFVGLVFIVALVIIANQAKEAVRTLDELENQPM